MFKLDSESALLSAFRPRDRKLLELPADARFPLIVRDYLAWQHPAGGRVFLVFSAPGGVPTGIAFDSNGGGVPIPQMCEWCRSPAVAGQVGLLTAQLNSKKRVGVHVCRDLSCKAKLEDEADRSGRSALPDIERALARMRLFAADALGIDLSGAGR